MPELKELHVRANSLGSPQEGASYPGVQTLNLDDNGITSWTVLRDVAAAFPDLHSLQLNDNLLADDSISDIVAPEGLRSLSLSGNTITSWETIGWLLGSDPIGSRLKEFRMAR